MGQTRQWYLYLAVLLVPTQMLGSAILKNAEFSVNGFVLGYLNVNQTSSKPIEIEFSSLGNNGLDIDIVVKATVQQASAGALIGVLYPTSSDAAVVGSLQSMVTYQVMVTEKRTSPIPFTSIPILASAKTTSRCGQGRFSVSGSSASIATSTGLTLISSCPPGSSTELVRTKDFFPLDVPVDVQMVGSMGFTFFYSKSADDDPSIQTAGFADPIFEIDPSFEFADFYTLQYSENLFATEPAPVPEPSSLALVPLSMGVFVTLRRARTKMQRPNLR